MTVPDPNPAPDPNPVDDATTPEPKSRFTLHLVQGLIALLLVAAVSVTAIVVLTNHGSGGSLTGGNSANSTSPKNMASYGVLLVGSKGNITTVRTPAVAIGHPVPTDTGAHSKTTNIVEYIDFQCPICLEFEKANLNNTADLVAQGKATLEIHPVSILDRSSQGTRYSSRSANAAACVANFDPDEYLNVVAALYSYQPAEGSTGLTNAEILTVLGKADVGTAAITKCVDTETYRDWVTQTTNAVESDKFAHVATTPVEFEGTPTVFVNGALYNGSVTDPTEFSAFVAAHSHG